MTGPRYTPDDIETGEHEMTDSTDLAELRATAAEWHGGQWSPLYAFASSGTVVRGAAHDAEHAMRYYCDDKTDAERAELRRLRDYLSEHEPAEPDEEDED